MLQGGNPGDFSSLLRSNGVQWPPESVKVEAREQLVGTDATTVLSLKFKDGVIVAGDRRATAGHVVVFDRTEKVLQLDSHSVLGIAGVPAFAWEIARVLRHSFKYFRRSQLQELSLDGKLRSLSNLLREQLPWLVQGVGVVAPLFACWEPGLGGRVFFYDPMGAQFEGAQFAATGSGSTVINAILLHRTRYEQRSLDLLDRGEAISLALQLLEVAADSDAATGGSRLSGDIFPTVHLIDDYGVQEIEEIQLKKHFLR